MSEFDILSALRDLWPLYPRIKTAIAKIEQIASDPQAAAAVAEAQKILADPGIKDAIAVFQEAAAILRKAQGRTWGDQPDEGAGGQ